MVCHETSSIKSTLYKNQQICNYKKVKNHVSFIWESNYGNVVFNKIQL